MLAAPAPPRATPRADVHWVYLSTIYFLLAGAIFYLYLARVLPAEELGAVVILQAIATVASVCVAIGLGYGFQHFLAFYTGKNDPTILRLLLRGSLLSGGLLAVIGFGVTFALSGLLGTLLFRSGDYLSAIQLVGLYAGLLAALAILQGVVLGLQRFVSYSAIAIATYTTTYGGAALLVAWRPGVQSIVVGWVLGASVGCTLYVLAILLERAGGRRAVAFGPRGTLPAAPLFRSIVLYSLPIFVYALLVTSATYVDRLVLASISDLASVGLYNYALLIVGGSLVAVGPFGTILLPKVSEYLGRNDRAAIRAVTRISVTLVVLVYVPLAVGLACLGPFLLRVLVGVQFVPDSLPMAVLLLLTAVAVPSSVLASVAAGARLPLALAKAAAFSLAANAAISIILVPLVGVLGAAIGNSAMSWGLLLVLLLQLRGTGFIEIDLRSVARIWLAALAMGAVVGFPLLVGGYGVFLVVPVVGLGAVVLLLSLRALRAIPSEAAEYIVHILPSRLHLLLPAISWVAGFPLTPASEPLDTGRPPLR